MSQEIEAAAQVESFRTNLVQEAGSKLFNDTFDQQLTGNGNALKSEQGSSATRDGKMSFDNIFDKTVGQNFNPNGERSLLGAAMSDNGKFVNAGTQAGDSTTDETKAGVQQGDGGKSGKPDAPAESNNLRTGSTSQDKPLIQDNGDGQAAERANEAERARRAAEEARRLEEEGRRLVEGQPAGTAGGASEAKPLENQPSAGQPSADMPRTAEGSADGSGPLVTQPEPAERALPRHKTEGSADSHGPKVTQPEPAEGPLPNRGEGDKKGSVVTQPEAAERSARKRAEGDAEGNGTLVTQPEAADGPIHKRGEGSNKGILVTQPEAVDDGKRAEGGGRGHVVTQPEAADGPLPKRNQGATDGRAAADTKYVQDKCDNRAEGELNKKPNDMHTKLEEQRKDLEQVKKQLDEQNKRIEVLRKRSEGSTGPEVNKPEVTKPENSKPESTSDSRKPENGRTDGRRPEAADGKPAAKPSKDAYEAQRKSQQTEIEKTGGRVIKPGDTLSHIAEANLKSQGQKVTPRTVLEEQNRIAKLNGIRNPNSVPVGTRVKVR